MELSTVGQEGETELPLRYKNIILMMMALLIERINRTNLHDTNLKLDRGNYFSSN
jgi:hypothetical protein